MIFLSHFKIYSLKLFCFFKNILSNIKVYIASHLMLQYVVISFITTIITESFNRRSLSAAFDFLSIDFFAFLVSFFIILTTLSFTHICKKRNFYKCFLAFVWVVLSFVSYVVFSFRLLPFNFNDLLILPGTFTILPKYLSIWHLTLILLAFSVALIIVIKLYRSTKSVLVVIKKDVIFPICMLVFTLLYCIFARGVGVLDDKISGLTNKYERNGFVYCFTSSVFERGMREPTDYSSVEVATIVHDVNKDNSSNRLSPNIIFLQLESFFDVNNVKELSFSENPIPTFNSLEERFSHGYLNVPTFSAGTANTEFEVLSGMNVDFLGIGEIAYSSVVGKKPVETVCHILKKYGYTTHAIHNNNASFYKRNEIYKSLGFDTFTSLEYMYDVEYNALGWARDKVLISSINDCLNSTEANDMIYTVGVQTHGTFTPDLIDTAPLIDVNGIDNQSVEASFEYYISQLKQVDTFLSELISVLEKRNEPTMLVVFGDHMPGFEVEDEQLLNDSKYQTEYVIWSNFQTDCVIKNLHSYHLYSYVLEHLNLEGGTISKLHSKYSYTPTEEYLQKFELIQFDMLEGEGISYTDYSPYTVNTKMGIRPIEIKKAYLLGEDLILEGQNFTPFSKAQYGSDILQTEYVDKNKLIVKQFKPKENLDMVSVVQTDESAYILSSTKSVSITKK